MRGIQFVCTQDNVCIGITPAHAGNTSSVIGGRSVTEDHPRACGEYHRTLLTDKIHMGSPPRMRGIQFSFVLATNMVGITPAHAGNTGKLLTKRAEAEDHPRACGEYLAMPSVLVGISGSPPRMRGIPEYQRRQNEESRITPAHAGNTLPFLWVTLPNRDHPRACGEYPA